MYLFESNNFERTKRQSRPGVQINKRLPIENNRPEHIFVDRDKSEGKTYKAVIKETRAEDEGKWRCQCGNEEATATLRIQPTTSLYLTGPEPTIAAKSFTAEEDSSITLSCPVKDPHQMIDVIQPDGPNGLHCKSFNSCSSNFGFIFERNLSTTSNLVFSVPSVQIKHDGNWTCRNGNVDMEVFRLNVNIRTTTLPHAITGTSAISCQKNLQSRSLHIIVLQLVCWHIIASAGQHTFIFVTSA